MEFARPEWVTLEWVAVPFSRGSSQPRDWTQVSLIADEFFTAEPQGKPKNTGVGSLCLLQWIFPNRGLLHCRQILYQLSYQGRVLYKWGAGGALYSEMGAMRVFISFLLPFIQVRVGEGRADHTDVLIVPETNTSWSPSAPLPASFLTPRGTRWWAGLLSSCWRWGCISWWVDIYNLLNTLQ